MLLLYAVLTLKNLASFYEIKRKQFVYAPFPVKHPPDLSLSVNQYLREICWEKFLLSLSASLVDFH